MRYTSPLFFLFLTSCLVTPIVPKKHIVGDKTYTETGGTALGFIPWGRKMNEDKTIEQKKEDLKFEAEKKEVEIELDSKERQRKTAYWFGVGFFLAAAVCVFLGYLLQGWKFWGGVSLLSGALGVAAWSFEQVIGYLKYPAYAIGAAVILWTMWKMKDFALLDKLKKSEPGKLL